MIDGMRVATIKGRQNGDSNYNNVRPATILQLFTTDLPISQRAGNSPFYTQRIRVTTCE